MFVYVLGTNPHNMIQPAAASTLFVYDVLLHLDVEIKYIWAYLDPRKFPIKRAQFLFSLLYLAQRYSPMLDMIGFELYC